MPIRRISIFPQCELDKTISTTTTTWRIVGMVWFFVAVKRFSQLFRLNGENVSLKVPDQISFSPPPPLPGMLRDLC